MPIKETFFPFWSIVRSDDNWWGVLFRIVGFFIMALVIYKLSEEAEAI